MIRDLLQNWGEVNLFTRPRRFGKSLNMSMLKTFFEIGCDQSLFDGLEIAEEKELCHKYMGQFPVISISLKDGYGLTFEAACTSMRGIIGREAMRFSFLETSAQLTDTQKNMYRKLVDVGTEGLFTMSNAVFESSLQTLSLLLYRHYQKKS